MARRWLILADDLTGAADCAIAFARRGATACVQWGEAGPGADEAVLSHDADSRQLGPDAAAARHAALAERLHDPDRAVFKKIDSTLRGQPAAELAATLDVLRRRNGGAFAILAPAFPATGRTTEDGRIRVAGRPLAETELWRRDHTYPTDALPAMLDGAGLTSTTIPLATVRAAANPCARRSPPRRGIPRSRCSTRWRTTTSPGSPERASPSTRPASSGSAAPASPTPWRRRKPRRPPRPGRSRAARAARWWWWGASRPSPAPRPAGWRPGRGCATSRWRPTGSSTRARPSGGAGATRSRPPRRRGRRAGRGRDGRAPDLAIGSRLATALGTLRAGGAPISAPWWRPAARPRRRSWRGSGSTAWRWSTRSSPASPSG